MLPFVLEALSDSAMAGLKVQQEKVDAEETALAKYEKATTLFKSKSPAAAFREVKMKLAEASPSGDACYYCERDRYRDIEHVKPKRHYPEVTFDWFNYVYACAICNQDAKSDTYAVFTTGTNYVEFNRQWPQTDPLPQGDPVLVDPRSENPLEFMQLDFDTGGLVSISEDPRIVVRGNYTRDMFGLDAADLTRIRRNFVKFYLLRCRELIKAQEDGDDFRAKLILKDILEMEHPTVIVELRRQADSYTELRELFDRLPPEVGSWPPLTAAG